MLAGISRYCSDEQRVYLLAFHYPEIKGQAARRWEWIISSVSFEAKLNLIAQDDPPPLPFVTECLSHPTDHS